MPQLPSVANRQNECKWKDDRKRERKTMRKTQCL